MLGVEPLALYVLSKHANLCSQPCLQTTGLSLSIVLFVPRF